MHVTGLKRLQKYVLFFSGDNQEEERYRRPTRAKPIMIPVDQPPPPRERKKCSYHNVPVVFNLGPCNKEWAKEIVRCVFKVKTISFQQ